MNTPVKKLRLTPAEWEAWATAAAVEAGLNPVAVLAGNGSARYCGLRWKLWRELHNAGYSRNSISTASGFDHSTVGYVCQTTHAPRLFTRREASA